jgi:predicted TIM-barrel fold metal-dependent hydrolase
MCPAMGWSKVLADFSSFYFNTALSARPAAAELLAFADADHITFGSDYPFAPLPARKYFADNLDNYDASTSQGSTRSTAPTRSRCFRGLARND